MVASLTRSSFIDQSRLRTIDQVTMILTEDELFESWKQDITTMSSRIIEMRDALFELLNDKLKTPAPSGRKDWSHIKEQIVRPFLPLLAWTR